MTNRICECVSCRDAAILASEFLCQLIDKDHCALSLLAVTEAAKVMAVGLTADNAAAKFGMTIEDPIALILVGPKVRAAIGQVEKSMEEELTGNEETARMTKAPLDDAVDRAIERRSGNAEDGNEDEIDKLLAALVAKRAARKAQ